MKKVLVMGGSRFIGKHIVTMLKDHYEVIVLNRGNVSLNDPLVHELVCDRNHLAELKDLLAPYRFEYVIDISGYTASQSEGLVQSLDLSQLKTFVYISTSATYDMAAGLAARKETDPIGGDSPTGDYAKNKIEAEHYLNRVFREDQLVIFRPPVVYGEDNYILRERLMFHLIEHDLPVYVPKSNNVLSLVYVRDLARDVKLACDGVIPGGIYNVGNQTPLTLVEWVKLCAKVMNKTANIVLVDVKEHALEARYFFPYIDLDWVLSVDKIKAFAPQETPYEVGFKRAYDDYVALESPIQMPEKMKAMRSELNKRFLND